MKEFIVNSHKLATVECEIPFVDCPVYKMLRDKKYSGGAEFVGTSVCGQTVNIGTILGQTCALKSEIMNVCMDCDVRAR